MKKIIISALTLLLPLMAAAQSVDSKINKIRELYNQAQEIAKWKNTDEWMEHGCYSFDFNSRINYAAAGVISTNTEVFIDVSDDYEGDNFNMPSPWFVREKSSRASELYRELLFDTKTGNLIFCYLRCRGESGNMVEQRLYYEKGKLLKAVPAKIENTMYSILNPLDVAKTIKEMVNSLSSIDY